jgi:hypothetical protein
VWLFCFNKRVSVNIGCCSVLRFLSPLVCSVFLIMFPEYILMSCVWVIIYLVRYVLVLRCVSAGVVNSEITKQVTSSWSILIQVVSGI